MVMIDPYPNLRSPVRVALNRVWHDNATYDLRHQLRFDTCPIEVCRQFAVDIDLGVYTRVFGEEAEREFCNNAWRYYRWRDKQALVDLYLRNIMGTYVHTEFRNAGGEIVGLDICISPPLQATALPASYIAETLRAMRWGLPWYSALSPTNPGPGLTVTACVSVEADVMMGVGFYARTTFSAIGAGS